MSELKKFLETHKLDRKVQTIISKENEELITTAFYLYGIKDYKYHGNNKMQPPEIRKLFPENITNLQGIVISPYTQQDIDTIIKLAENDTAVEKEIQEEYEETKELLKHYV